MFSLFPLNVNYMFFKTLRNLLFWITCRQVLWHACGFLTLPIKNKSCLKMCFLTGIIKGVLLKIVTKFYNCTHQEIIYNHTYIHVIYMYILHLHNIYTMSQIMYTHPISTVNYYFIYDLYVYIQIYIYSLLFFLFTYLIRFSY